MPDQRKGSDFCRDADLNMARQLADFPSCPLLSDVGVDCSWIGCASGDQRRAVGISFCSAKRPVSNSLVFFAGSVGGCVPLSQPANNMLQSSTPKTIAFFVMFILLDRFTSF